MIRFYVLAWCKSCGNKLKKRAGKGEEKTNASAEDKMMHVSKRRRAENVLTHGSAGQRTGGGSARILACPVEHAMAVLDAEAENQNEVEKGGKGYGLGSPHTHVAAAFLGGPGKVATDRPR